MDFDILLRALTSYFVIINPIGTAMVFHSLTDGGDRAYSPRMAPRAVLISTVIVFLFADRSTKGHTSALILAVLLSYVLVLSGILLAHHIRRLIGKTGDDILRRLLGVVLCCTGYSVCCRWCTPVGYWIRENN